jgi:hypothetical protein
VAKTEPVITQQQRLEHIGRLLNPADSLAVDERAAALLFLLYAQPLVRIAGMRLEQIHDDDATLSVSFTGDRLELPAPVVADSRTTATPSPYKHRRNAGATFIDYASRRSQTTS